MPIELILPLVGLWAWLWGYELEDRLKRANKLYRSFGAAAPRHEDQERRQQAKNSLESCQMQYALANILQGICLVLSLLALSYQLLLAQAGIP